MPVSCKTILWLHGNEGVVFRILVTVSIPCLLWRNKLNKIRKLNVSIIKWVGKTADCSSSVANLQLVILWSMRRLFSDQVRFMHLTILSRPGGGGIQGMGIWHFSKICRQIPSHPGLHIVVHPKAGPKKGIIKISPNTTLQSINQSIY